MLEQLKEMMGESEQQMDQPGEPKEGEGDKPGQKPGDKPGEGGPGGTTNKKNDELKDGGGEGGDRKLDKKTGMSSSELPDEYRKQIDAYNKKTR